MNKLSEIKYYNFEINFNTNNSFYNMNEDIVFVVFSNYNYVEHRHNVLKECLQSWVSDKNYRFVPNDIDIKEIRINPDNEKDKMFIVSTTKDWLMVHNLEYIIDNELFAASSYVYALLQND